MTKCYGPLLYGFVCTIELCKTFHNRVGALSFLCDLCLLTGAGTSPDPLPLSATATVD